MSPEQSAGQKITTSSDQYSLGCVLFECLTGEPPFRCDTALDTMQMHLNTNPPDPAEYSYTKIPPRLGEVVTRMLGKKPEDRFASMQELIDELEELRELAIENERAQPVNTESAIESYNLKRFLTKRVLIIGGCCALMLIAAFTLVIGRNTQLVEVHRDETQDLRILDKSLQTKTSNGPVLDMAQLPVVTDELMAGFADRTDLKKADLSHSAISDEGLKYLRKSRNLTNLRLKNTDVKTLKYLPDFKSVEWLTLNQTAVDDAAIEKLAQLPRLQILEINQCENLTDKCLESLKKCPSLGQVQIFKTHISKSAVLAAQKSMPCCIFPPLVTSSLISDTVKKARQFSAAKQPEKALPLYKKCVDTISSAQGSNCPLTAQYLRLISICYGTMGRRAESLLYADKCVAVARASGDKVLLTVMLNYLSQHLVAHEKDAAAALKVRREQVELIKETGDLEETGRDAVFGMAQLLVATGQLGEADQCYRKCLSLDRRKSKDRKQDAEVRTISRIKCGQDLQGLAVVLYLGGNVALSEKLSREAYEIIPAPQSPSQAADYAGLRFHLATVLMTQGKSKESIQYFQQAADTAKAFNLSTYKVYAMELQKALIKAQTKP